MTREEAIQWLESVEVLGFDEKADRIQEALKTAIEALKLPQGVIHCKDCRWWSRKGDSSFGYCYAIRHSYYSRRWEVNIYRTYEEDFYCADAELPPQEEEEE